MIIVPFIIIGVAVIVISIILVRIVIAPKRVAQLELLYKQKRIPSVIKVAKQILAKNNRSSIAHYYLGLSYLSDAKPELALMEFRTVDQIGIFDGSIKENEFRGRIAELYLRFNQLEEAQKEYLLLINLEPENPEFHYQAGKLFEARSHADKAVKYYKKTIELDKRHADAFARLGTILYRAKRTPDARVALEQAAKLQPNNAQACFTLGKIYKEARDFQTALSYFEKSSRDNELKLKSLIERGTCYITMGDLERAGPELERATKLITDEASADAIFGQYLLAYCYEQARRYDEAIRLWSKIQAKKPNFKDVPAKLSQYQDIQTEDSLKDYLVSAEDEFMEICRAIVKGLGQSILEEKTVDGGFEFLGGDSQTKWRNTKKLPTLYRFVRETDPTEEADVRAFHERTRSANINRSVFVTSSTFSRGAREFSESRPIDLIDKDKLLNLLSTHVKG